MKYVRVRKGKMLLEGYLMPKHAFSSEEVVVIKLRNGYNVGIKADDIEILEEVEEDYRERSGGCSEGEVALISTGGTIASFVEYNTGAVRPAMSSEDFIYYAPELESIARIKPVIFLSIFSEDMRPEYWESLAEKCAEEIRSGISGIVIAHGTDTMHYTSAALSFALQNLPCPVVFVGAQRSSDRPSSDAHLNLLSAVRVAKSNLGEVVVVMHHDTSDNVCAIHRGTRVRKMHTSARNAFRSVNSKPIGYVHRDGKIELIDALERRTLQELSVMKRFVSKSILIYYYPGAPLDILEFAAEKHDAIVIMGTGLGHVGEDWRKRIGDITRDGKYVFMTSQCIFGTTNLNVYSSGRELLKNGVIPLWDMLPEVALVKSMWALANFSYEDVGKVMLKNYCGEISERREWAW